MNENENQPMDFEDFLVSRTMYAVVKVTFRQQSLAPLYPAHTVLLAQAHRLGFAMFLTAEFFTILAIKDCTTRKCNEEQLTAILAQRANTIIEIAALVGAHSGEFRVQKDLSNVETGWDDGQEEDQEEATQVGLDTSFDGG